MSMFQRKLINDSIKNGDPLPLPPKTSQHHPEGRRDTDNVRKIHLPRRRKKEQIEMSGAYNREDNHCYKSRVDYEQEKRRLQDLMAFGKTIKKPLTTQSAADIDENDEKEKQKSETITWILKEIEEREQFLCEMKKLGQEKQYESIIRQEIAAKLRALEDIDKGLKNVLKKDYKEHQEIKAATNTLFHD